MLNEDVEITLEVIMENTTLSKDDLACTNEAECPVPAFRIIPPMERIYDENETLHKTVSDWTIDLTEMPAITMDAIQKYFVTDLDGDGKPRNAGKHKINGYQLFKDGYVKKIRVSTHIDNVFLIKNSVTSTMKKDIYSVIIHICKLSGKIIYGRCSCKAGGCGCCKHVAATLYQCVEYKQLGIKSVPVEKTCTGVLQKWHIPGEGASNDCLKFSDLTFQKADLKKDQENLRKRSIVTGSRSFCATPAFAHKPSKEKLKKLSDDLLNLGQGVQLAQVIKENDYKPSSFYETSITQYQKINNATVQRRLVPKVMEKISNNVMITDLSLEHKNFITAHLLLTFDETIQLEQKTVDQSLSDQWYEERKKRITASHFGSVINRRKSIYPKSIIKSILSNKTPFKSEACQWGHDKEKVAISMYEQKFNVNVESCGLIINPKWPWLGASADGVVDINGDLRAVEVKSPFSRRTNTIEECCMDTNFYLHAVNDTFKLKEKHPYFYQCQGVMAILELSSLDFIVYTSKGLHIENITFQRETWAKNILPKLTKFYFEFLKDSIFAV